MRRGGIWIVPALGGAPRQVSDFGSDPAWSPDGRRARLPVRPPGRHRARGLWRERAVHDLDGRARRGDRRRITSSADPSAAMPRRPGLRTASTSRSPPIPPTPRRLWSVPADGGSARLLDEAHGAIFDPVFAPDGRSDLLRDGRAVHHPRSRGRGPPSRPPRGDRHAGPRRRAPSLDQRGRPPPGPDEPEPLQQPLDGGRVLAERRGDGAAASAHRRHLAPEDDARLVAGRAVDRLHRKPRRPRQRHLGDERRRRAQPARDDRRAHDARSWALPPTTGRTGCPTAHASPSCPAMGSARRCRWRT